MSCLTKALVVGAGINGLCVAREFLLNGWDVTVVDKAMIPNVHATSYSRLCLSHPYISGSSSLYPPAVESLDRWRGIWDTIGVNYFWETSVVALNHDKDMTPVETEELQILSPKELFDMFPLLQGGSFVSAMRFPRFGVLFADKIVAVLARELRESGVNFISNCHIQSLNPEQQQIRDSIGRTYSADVIVVTVGPGMKELLGPQDWPGIEREQFSSIEYHNLYADVPTKYKGSGIPAWASLSPTSDLWGGPMVDGSVLKLGCCNLKSHAPAERGNTTTGIFPLTLLKHYENLFPKFSELSNLKIETKRIIASNLIEPMVYRDNSTYLLVPTLDRDFQFAPLYSHHVNQFVCAGVEAESFRSLY